MQKNQFQRRFQAFQIPKEELERMYRREMEIQEQMKMMAEAAFQLNNQSASGVGAPQSQNSDLPPLEFGLTSLIFWQDPSTGTWKFLVHDYETNTTSEEYDTELDFVDFNSYSNDEIVEQGGYMLSFSDNTNSLRTVFFVSALGEVVQRVDGNFLIDDSFRQWEFIVTTYYYDSGSSLELYIFDGTYVNNHSFPSGSSITYNISGGEITSERSISFILNDGVTTKTYIASRDGNLVDVTAQAGDPNDYDFRTSLQSDFFVCRKYDPGNSLYTDILIFDQMGSLKNSFDLTPYNLNSQWYGNLYGNNMYAAVLYNGGDDSVDFLIIKYDSTQDTFYTETNERGATFVDVGSYWDFRETVDDFPNDTPNVVFYFVDSPGFNVWGQTNSYVNVIWSIGSGSWNKEVFANGTQKEFYFNTSMLADTPLLPFAEVGSTGNIEVAVLKSDTATFLSSGQSYSTCTQVSAFSLGEETMLVFNDNASNGRFEFWGITQQTSKTISSSWSAFTNGGSVLVVDNDDIADTFWYTVGTGTPTTISTLTNIGISNAMYYGTLTGVEDGYLVFYDYNTNSQAFQTAYILGTSEGLVGPRSGNSTSDGTIDLGKTTFAWKYQDPTSNKFNLFQFSNTNFAILNSVDTDEASLLSYDVYSDRIYAVSENSGVYSVFLLGPGGNTELTITASNLYRSHNDAYWAD